MGCILCSGVTSEGLQHCGLVMYKVVLAILDLHR
jgi:hypothetical protein